MGTEAALVLVWCVKKVLGAYLSPRGLVFEGLFLDRFLGLRLGLIPGAHDQKGLGGLNLHPSLVNLPAIRIDLVGSVAEAEIDHAVLFRSRLLTLRLLFHPNRSSRG